MPSKAQYQKNKAYYLEQARLQSLTPEFKLLKQKYRASARGKLTAKLAHHKWNKENHDKATKTHWKAWGIICDYDAIYPIYINTHSCDHCSKVFGKFSRTLHHCHDCGSVLGIICRSPCNSRNLVPCPLCDLH